MLTRKKGLLCLLPAVLTFFLLSEGCSRVPEGNAENGARWFKLYRCIGCHGENGSGGKGPVIAGTSLTFKRFLHKLRSPNSAIMPSFDENRLPEKDAGEIYLWLVQQDK